MRSEVEKFISNFDKDYVKNKTFIYELFGKDGFFIFRSKKKYLML